MEATTIDRGVESTSRGIEYFSGIRGTEVCNFGIFSFSISVFLTDPSGFFSIFYIFTGSTLSFGSYLSNNGNFFGAIVPQFSSFTSSASTLVRDERNISNFLHFHTISSDLDHCYVFELLYGFA